MTLEERVAALEKRMADVEHDTFALRPIGPRPRTWEPDPKAVAAFKEAAQRKFCEHPQVKGNPHGIPEKCPDCGALVEL